MIEPYFSKRLTPTQRDNNIALVRNEAVITTIKIAIHGVATHPKDDLVLATAISGRVQYLVTGDTKLQELGTYEGITIVSPRDFLDAIQMQVGEGQ